MKRSKNLIAAIALVAIFTACSTLYTSTVTITKVVDSAMKEWGYMSKHGQTSAKVDAEVIKAHDIYRNACNVAKTALIKYKESGEIKDYNEALIAVRASVDDLFELIVPLLSQSKAETLTTNLQKASSL